MIKISRKIGRAKLYRINSDNPMVKMLSEYTTEFLQEMEKQAKALPAR